jgi:hypothetical protein
MLRLRRPTQFWASIRRWLRLASIILAELAVLAALAFSTYVAIDTDLRTLVWSKWKQDVEYEFPGGSQNIEIDIGELDPRDR